MIRRVLVLLLTVVLSMVLACLADKDRTNRQTREPIAGGWSDASVEDEGVKSAAREGVSIKGKETGINLQLTRILEARKQVVAGMNYRLKIRVMGAGKENTATIVVWSKLDRTYELTKWLWE
jgi:hypothetical protein